MPSSIYDWHGVYGHPDHVQVHRVGRRAAEIAGTPRVLEATMNRDAMSSSPSRPGRRTSTRTVPPTTATRSAPRKPSCAGAVDVSGYLGRKREALACHASQVSDAGMMLQMPDDFFAKAFGTEWYIEPDVGAGLTWAWPFA